MRNPLRQWLVTLAGLLLVTALPAAPPAPAVVADSDIQVLRVARTLALSADQIAALQPLLDKAQELTAQLQKDLDALWTPARDSVNAVTEAWANGQPADRTAKATADRAADSYEALQTRYNQAVDDLLRQLGRVLTPRQDALVAMPRDLERQLNNRRQLQGASSLADYMARDVTALRRLLPPEYDTLRVAVAMRLAARVTDPDSQAFANAVNQLLRIEDTVRRMTDREFSDNEARLPNAIADALNLPPGARGQGNLLAYNDVRNLLLNPNTGALLKTFQPVAPQGGGGQ